MSCKTTRTCALLRQGLAALALAALCSAGLPARAERPGLVQGVLGVAVSPAPGQPASQRLRGGTALRLDGVSLDGAVWSHLLASDGSHGWTAQTLPADKPVTARPVGLNFELMPLPPGSPDFQSSMGQPVPGGSIGRLLGGSRESQVATMQDLQVPAWLNPSLAPWPRWAMGGVQGYAPISQLALDWSPGAEAAAGAASAAPSAAAPATKRASVPDLLAARGLTGLSRAPFLAPLAAQLRGAAPADGTPALDLSTAPDKAPETKLLHGDWQGPLSAYLAAGDRAHGRLALLTFGQGKARSFVLLDHAGAPQVLYANDDGLFIARLDEADLDGDGLPEWLLEVVGVYGDGYYAELWVVDGRSGPAGPSVQRQVLSRSSGEASSQAQDAAWSVGADSMLWVWRSTAKGSRLTALRYAHGRLTAVAAARSPVVVVLGSDASVVAARQRQMQTAALRTMVLPRQTPSGLRWLTAMPSASQALAKRWAASHGLPATVVQTLPWGQ